MPTAPTAPPAIPQTAVAPTPGKPYNLSEHTPSAPAPRNPALTDALNRRAGVAPTAPTTPPGEARIIPSQPPRPPLETPPAKPDAPASPPPPAKPDAKSDDKPAPHVKFITPDELPAENAPATPPPAPDETPEPSPETLKGASAQLREAFERVKANRDKILAERDLTRKEAGEFRARLKGYEDRIKTLESAEARAKELEKQVLTKDELIRVTNYTQSEEYHTTYERPVVEATQAAYSLVKDLLVTNEDGTMRAGTPQDFQMVLAQPNHTLAKAKARELFGEDFASEVFQASLKVREKLAKRSKALEEAGTRSLEYAKQQQERAAANRTEVRAAFERATAELDSRYPGLYTPNPTDAEAKAARQQGEELARVIVEGQPPDMPSQQYMATVAKVYHRAASWPMHQLQLSRLQAELDATKARLAAYEKSTPDGSSRQQPGGVQQDSGGVVVGGQTDYSRMMRESLTRRAGGRR